MDNQFIKGTVEKIVYQNADNGYTIARLDPEDTKDIPQVSSFTENNYITIVGYFQGLKAGETIKAYGKWKEHPRFGTQYTANKIEKIRPKTLEGITHYLGGGLIPGIGNSMAERIVAKFKDKTLEVMDNDIYKLTKVSGIGKKKIEAIKTAWVELKESRSVFLFLQEIGATPKAAQKIYKQYGSETQNIIDENPYRLAEDIWGIGFLKADSIAKSMGHDKNSHFRIRAGIKYILSKSVDYGHVYLNKDEVIKETSKLLGIETSLITYTIDDEININQIVDDNGRIYLPGLFYSENNTADILASLNSSTPEYSSGVNIEENIKTFEKAKKIEFHKTQREAITSAFRQKITVITGGPGTGKTTIIMGILNYARSIGKNIILVAPTGRAAKRMEEVTGYTAKTIHRALEYNPSTGFMRNAQKPLEADMIIVDEVSMVDLPLMHAFLKAVPNLASVVLVGDKEQLPSVGPGQVLKDIINSGIINVVELKEIFRQVSTSKIITSAHAVSKGNIPDLENKKESDFHFIEENDAQLASQIIFSLVMERLPNSYNVNPIKDIQVITPMYKRLCGVENLNKILQAGFHNQKPTTGYGYKFYVGDKVMQTKNNYEKKVFNGDIGYIKSIESGNMQVYFDNIIVEYSSTEKEELVLAYAITVHKSQGNEYPIVILPALTQHYVMLYRNLFYTAITRAKKHLIIVGSKKAVSIAVKNDDPHNRNTYLKERLKNWSAV